LQKNSFFLRGAENGCFAADMARMAEDPKTQEWWTHTDPCQSPLTSGAQGEQWSMMEEVFHTE